MVTTYSLKTKSSETLATIYQSTWCDLKNRDFVLQNTI